MMTRMTLGDVSVEVEFKDIKHLHLNVFPPDGRVRISAPKRMGAATVRAFIAVRSGAAVRWGLVMLATRRNARSTDQGTQEFRNQLARSRKRNCPQAACASGPDEWRIVARMPRLFTARTICTMRSIGGAV